MVNAALVYRNWYLRKRIAEEELKGESRAEYGLETIKKLSSGLTQLYGKGFGRQELYKFVQFYKMFPEIVDSLSRQSAPLLSWAHYRTLLRVYDDKAREWYTREAAEQGWSVRTLDRQTHGFYYDRLLATQNEDDKREVAAAIQKTQPAIAADSIVRDLRAERLICMQAEWLLKVAPEDINRLLERLISIVKAGFGELIDDNLEPIPIREVGNGVGIS